MKVILETEDDTKRELTYRVKLKRDIFVRGVVTVEVNGLVVVQLDLKNVRVRKVHPGWEIESC